MTSSLKKLIEAAYIWFMLAFAALCVAGMVSMMVDTYRMFERYDREYDRLIAESKRDNAHQFLVYHWMKCGGWPNSRATCFAAIHTTAVATRGEQFAARVDAAAKRMGLL